MILMFVLGVIGHVKIAISRASGKRLIIDVLTIRLFSPLSLSRQQKDMIHNHQHRLSDTNQTKRHPTQFFLE